VVLSLLDQLYCERARLRRLRDALRRAADRDMLQRLAAALEEP
jgi:hypothetical protein